MAKLLSDKSYEAAIDTKRAQEEGTYTLSDSSSSQSSISDGKTFLTAGLKDAYIPIYKYEGKHRWEVNFQWTPEEEKAVVRKVFVQVSCLIHLANLNFRSTSESVLGKSAIALTLHTRLHLD